MLEYSQHIDFKVASGLSEEEAIRDFGDIDQLADEILDAYNVNTEYMKNQKQPLEKTVASWLKKIADTIDRVSENIMKRDKKDILMIVVKFLIVLAFLAILRIPVEMIIGLVHMIFGFLPNGLFHVITAFIEICINIIYIAIICYTIYFFFKRTFPKESEEEDYGGAESPEGHTQHSNTSTYSYADSSASPGTANTSSYAQSAYENIDKDFNKKNFTWQKHKERKPKEPKPPREKKQSEGGFIKGLSAIISFFFKIIVILFLIPVCIAALLCIAGFGLLVSFTVQGFATVGLMLIALGGVLCLISLIFMIIRAVFQKQREHIQLDAKPQTESGVLEDDV